MDLPIQFQNYADADGIIKRLPVKLSKKIALANWALNLFEEGRVYSEKEVNETIGEHILDFALIRRMLVTSGHLNRDPYGREYRRVSNSKAQTN
ncbi:MAG: DUF2087 domain-containing protein [Microbacteriaceae bacterium]|nr:DUF2087 domain-containing protein [Microbacteriaceae bacterium]NBS60865.1 DUF2087 domain-containing protein [Microbacteriaceae bacterium]